MTRICAWCGRVMDSGCGIGVTHGCCPNCLAKLRNELRAIKEAERWTDLALNW